MRSALILTLSLTAAFAAVGAEKPIPQDHARIEARSRERLDWNRRTLAGNYDKVGKKDPRWDTPARQTLEQAARMFAQQVDPATTPLDIQVAAKKAVDAGCDDPLILYLYARSSVGPSFPGQDEFARRTAAAEKAMAASAYSPFRRASAIGAMNGIRASKGDLSPDDRRDLERGLDAVLDLLPKSVTQDPTGDTWTERWSNLLQGAIQGYRRLLGDSKAAADRVDARLAECAGADALRFAVRGKFLIGWGWEARTNNYAPKVTEEQFRTFEDRLRQARVALGEAWRKHPSSTVAADMMEVEKAIGRGDRKALELWFERAMETDPDNRTACWTKLDWLDPKWYGGDSPQAMLDFGRACRDTKNWRTGITLLCADAHLRIYTMLPQDVRAKYMASPAVWSDIQTVYEEYLKRMPSEDAERSRYAALCYLCDHYPEAHAQFQALGDRLTTWNDCLTYTLEDLKKIRSNVAQVVGAK